MGNMGERVGGGREFTNVALGQVEIRREAGRVFMTVAAGRKYTLLPELHKMAPSLPPGGQTCH